MYYIIQNKLCRWSKQLGLLKKVNYLVVRTSHQYNYSHRYVFLNESTKLFFCQTFVGKLESNSYAQGYTK